MVHELTTDRDGTVRLAGQLLIVRYPEGDCDVVTRDMDEFWKSLHKALYDEYQCSDVLKDGDEFSYGGKVAYRCEGVHVVMVNRL